MAFSHWTFNLRLIFLSFLISVSSTPYTLQNFLIQILTNLLSKSSPPKCVSPSVAMALKSLLFFRDNIDTSKVPPPKSNTIIFLLFLLSCFITEIAKESFKFIVVPNPYARAAAVGSVIVLKTLIPANLADSIIAAL